MMDECTALHIVQPRIIGHEPEWHSVLRNNSWEGEFTLHGPFAKWSVRTFGSHLKKNFNGTFEPFDPP